ncbi:hypothetical protein ACP70R_010345 [Stipagrostis hirtigluma subsp. patula]
MATNSTSSARASRCVTATHDFEVTNFSLLDGMGIDKYVMSSTFSVGGCHWNIRLFPDGSYAAAASEAPHVSAFLNFCGGAAGVMVSFSLGVLDKDGTVSNPRPVETHTFNVVGADWGFREFILKSKLRELLRLNDDCFTIRCIVTVINVSRFEAVNKIVVPQSTLHQDLAAMSKHGEGADVTFNVSGQLFHAHTCMLAARSKVFKAQLFGPMKEKDTRCIKIDDMEPTIFEALLYFIYTDSLPDDCHLNKNVVMQHLLVAADQYGLDRLRAMCEDKLCRDLDVQTIATTLVLAEQHHCIQLKDACLGFIASQDVLDAIKKTDGFKHLIRSCPMLKKEILDKVAAVRRH